MSINIIHGSPQTVWMPINPSATIYVGSIVSIDFSAIGTDEGVIVRPVAAGASNTTNKDRPIGVCVGTNRYEPVFSATYLADYITDEGVTGLRASTVDYRMVEGEWPKGGKQAMVQIALIDPSTVLRAPIRNGAIATAPTLLTSSAGNANGLTVTTGATDTAGVVGLNTIYCRTGLNAGTYRTTDDTSTTVHAWDRQMLNTTATVGETYVKVPVKSYGPSYVTIGDGTVASFIDAAIAPATAHDTIWVNKLNLAQAGNESVDFTFDSDHFCQFRA